MALDDNEVVTDDSSEDAASSFYNLIAEKYGADDDAEAERVDGMPDENDKVDAVKPSVDDDDPDDDEQEEGAGKGAGTRTKRGTAEHAKPDTSTETPDGAAAETDDDSEEDDDDEHPEGEEKPKDSATADADAAAAEAGEDDGKATAELLAAKGADLRLDDIPEEFRGIVQKKIKHIDGVFSRIAQEATAFRTDRAAFESDQRYREANPAHVIVEMIEKGGDALFEQVNVLLRGLETPEEKTKFEDDLKAKRQSAVDAVTAQYAELETRAERGEAVEAKAHELAAKAGVPFRHVERAVILFLKEKGGDAPDITDEELATIVRDEAKAHQLETRGNKRQQSKETVQARTATRQAARPGKAPASAAVPRPAAAKPEAIDWNDEESRQRAILGTARRVIPSGK